MNPKNKNTSPCTSVTSSRCVVWNGPTIPCLEICNGDVLTDVVFKVATKVCEIDSSLDLSTIDLTCLIDHTPPDNRSIRTILQLLFDNQCSLKNLIDAIQPGSGDVSLTLNLKCLKKFDAFDNEIPQDLNQTLQSIVDEVCTHKTDIATLKNTVIDLQDQIDNLPAPENYTEPDVTICTTGTSKKLSDAIPIIAQDLCDYKDVVGSDTDISSAIAKQCAGLNTLLGSVLGWDSTPATLADSLGNLWIAYCNLLNRVKVIETSCCGPTCDKIKLGATIVFNDDGTIDMNFTYGAGTFIPNGFVDCGSVIKLTDKNGVELTLVGTTISQDGVIEDINISTLATGTVSVSIQSKFCLADETGKTILTCAGCFNFDFENTMGCCVITNTDSAAQTIMYKLTLTT